MMRRVREESGGCRGEAAAATLAVGLLLGAAAGASAARAPVATVEGYRISLTRIQRTENLLAEFPEGRAGKLSGRQSLTLGLSVTPPNPAIADRIQGLAARVTGQAAGGAPLAFSQGVSDEQPADRRYLLWNLWTSELPPTIERISSLTGELVVYPRASRFTLELPVKTGTTLVREDVALKATVQQATQKGQTLTISLLIEWPRGTQVEFLTPDRATGAFLGLQVLGGAGVSVAPNTASQSTTEGVETIRHRFEATFADLKDAPTRLRLHVRTRSGEPRRIPFTLTDLALPAGSVEPAEDPDTGPSPGHPFYDPAGGSLVQPLRRINPEQEGVLLLGLAREGGPCRWFECAADPSGRALLSHLRPGRYRVYRRWLQDTGRALSLGPAEGLPVDIAAGQEFTLVPVTVKAGP